MFIQLLNVNQCNFFKFGQILTERKNWCVQLNVCECHQLVEGMSYHTVREPQPADSVKSATMTIIHIAEATCWHDASSSIPVSDSIGSVVWHNTSLNNFEKY